MSQIRRFVSFCMQHASSNSIYVFQMFSTSSSIINTSYVKAPWYDDSRSNQGSIYAPSGFFESSQVPCWWKPWCVVAGRKTSCPSYAPFVWRLQGVEGWWRGWGPVGVMRFCLFCDVFDLFGWVDVRQVWFGERWWWWWWWRCCCSWYCCSCYWCCWELWCWSNDGDSKFSRTFMFTIWSQIRPS